MEQIINSPPLQKELKPFEVRAGLSQYIDYSPVGFLCLREAGIAFLTSGSKKFTSDTNWAGLIGGSVGGIVGALIAQSIASCLKKDKKIGELVGHPNSLYIPYADIVSIEYKKSSKSMQLTRQHDHGLTESITLFPIDQDCVTLLIVARFNYEKSLYTDYILSHIKLDEFSAKLENDMEIMHGPKWRINNVEEFEKRSCLYIDDQLGENGLHNYLKERLSQFKDIPFLAEYFQR